MSVRVPRGEAGDLEAGVADVLENVDGVEAVDLAGVDGVRPTWTDIRVGASAELTLELPGEASGDTDVSADVAERLEDGFGVTDVHAVSIDEPS